MNIGITGHRPSRLGNEYNGNGPYSTYLRSELLKVIKIMKPVKIISGMALGFDTIAAELALAHNISLIAAIPFMGQEIKWPKSSQDKYYQILLDSLTTREYISGPGYSKEKMFKRDEWIVDNCDHLVAAWDGTESGGTYHTLKYAMDINRPFTVINPNTWKVTAKVVNIKKNEPYDVYIGRGSKWGNPFYEGNRKENIERYRIYIINDQNLIDSLPELKGKRLGCFCAPLPCHGDVLIELMLQRQIF